jgi:quercetin dioxygenase-like cupin family protein
MAALERDSLGGEDPVQKLLTAAACLFASSALAATEGRIVLDNARVRVIGVTSASAIAAHPAAVIVMLEDSATRKAGEAFWSGDPAAPPSTALSDGDSFLIVEPKEPPPTAAPPPPDAGATPAKPVFTGMSFTPLFENDRVTVIRGRMGVGAKEGVHTHASDIVVIHLSGGTILDTAYGNTKVNRWKHGDVEFEARGSSHSARNLGPAVDAVLVTLKP